MTGGDAEVTASAPPGAGRGDLFDPACATRKLLDRVGSRWTVMVVLRLAEDGETRFAELRRRVPGVSQKMLSSTLQGLTLDGLVARRVEETVPPRVHYRLTELGESLRAPLAALKDWAEAHMADVDRHRAAVEGPCRD